MPRRSPTARLAPLLLCLPLAGGGCAGWGVGAGQTMMQASMGPSSSSVDWTEDQTTHMDLGWARVNRFVLYDTSGVLLASLGSAASRRYEGTDAYGTSYYSYTAFAPMSGVTTEFSLLLGGGDSETVSQNGTSMDLDHASSSFFGIDERNSVAVHQSGTSRLLVQLNFLWEIIHGEQRLKTPGLPDYVNYSLGDFWVGMPFGLVYQWRVGPALGLSLGGHLDPVMGAVIALFRSDESHWFYADANARIDLALGSSLMLSLDGTVRKVPWGLGYRDGSSTEATAQLVYLF